VYFALTDEQRALQSSVRRFIADRFPLSAVREVFDDPGGDGDPAELWKRAAAQGWLAGLVPERFGGMGLGLVDVAVIARCWGEGVMPGALLPTVVAAEAIRLAGTPEQQEHWLARVASGDARLSLAVRSEADGVEVAGRDEALTGTVEHVEYAHVADRLVVAAREGDAVTLWLVDPAAGGVAITRRDALDRSTRLCSVSLDAAPGERLPKPEVLAEVLDRGAVLYANDLAGLARVALSRTVGYVRTREQFGRPIGSFQALKHALADLHVAVTMAEHAAWYAAYALDVSLPGAALAVSVAKAKANQAARDTTAAMIQYHGGIGYTWEHEAHFFFKRARREEHQYGDTIAHLQRVARIAVDGA
jgi:acyl-CoA dehydrogenase